MSPCYRPPALPPLTFQYADFAVWQRQQLAGEVMESQLSYWLEVLGDELPVLELPTDRPRPAVQTYAGARHYLDVSPETTAALRALARREETTSFVVGLAVFNLLIHRYTGRTDLPIGTTAAGRRHSGLESLLGLFMNLLVLRGSLAGEPTGRELVKRFQETVVNALAHQDVPFERVVDKLHIERDLSRSPVFQFQFNLQPASAQSMKRAGVVMTPVYVDSGTARFDMEMIMWDDEGGGLKGYMEYNVDLFDATTMDRLGRSFLHVFQELLRQPDAPMRRIIGLTPAESHQLLAEWNDTRRPELAGESVLPLIEARVLADPDADALVFEGERLSYRELDRRANQLAHFLRQRGAGPESVVGICMERCLELVVGLLGIMKAGGAYLPLDPRYPAERLQWMVEDAHAPVVLTRTAIRKGLPELATEIVDLDAGGPGLSELPADAPPSAITAAGAAYVIYTSGSTGTPKGVVSCHGGLANRLLWMQEAFALTPRDRVLQKTSFTFDVSVWEFFWPLMTGSALVLARPDGHRDAGYLAQLIAAEEVTTLHFVPSMLRVFLEAPEVAECGCLKRAILSGEAL
ncbi:MAG: AMP-binding protein, partial [bacterium]|nr:AMP-binding protein [bacterium]